MSQDGEIRAVQDDVEDRFCLDGARLVEIADEGDTVEYRTFPDSVAKVLAHGVLFRSTPTYDGPTVAKLFGGYQGAVVADASANHNVLFGPGEAREAGCWSHARRRFFKAFKAGAGKQAAFALQTIQALFHASERALRRVVKGRRNWLFHGSDEHAVRACAITSLIATCQMHGLDPELYLQEILTVAPSYPLCQRLASWTTTRSAERISPGAVKNPPLGPRTCPSAARRAAHVKGLNPFGFRGADP